MRLCLDDPGRGWDWDWDGEPEPKEDKRIRWREFRFPGSLGGGRSGKKGDGIFPGEIYFLKIKLANGEMQRQRWERGGAPGPGGGGLWAGDYPRLNYPVGLGLGLALLTYQHVSQAVSSSGSQLVRQLAS